MGKETQFARPELVSFIAQMQLEIQGVGVVNQLRREEPAVLVIPISREPQKLFRDDKTTPAFNSLEGNL
jgi:hypothetical protein